MRPALTERQREILNYIEREVRTTGVPPSIRQIGVALGISSTNGVHAHLQALEKKGYIHRSSRTSRALHRWTVCGAPPPERCTRPLQFLFSGRSRQGNRLWRWKTATVSCISIRTSFTVQ